MSERKRFVRSLSRRALVQQIVYRSLYFQWSIKCVESGAIRTHLEFRLRAPTINSLNAARINGDSARKRQLEVEGTFYFLHARDSKQKHIPARNIFHTHIIEEVIEEITGNSSFLEFNSLSSGSQGITFHTFGLFSY